MNHPKYHQISSNHCIIVHNCIGVANHHRGGLLVNTQRQSRINVTRLISNHRQSLLPSAFQEAHWTKTLHKAREFRAWLGKWLCFAVFAMQQSPKNVTLIFLCCNAAFPYHCPCRCHGRHRCPCVGCGCGCQQGYQLLTLLSSDHCHCCCGHCCRCRSCCCWCCCCCCNSCYGCDMLWLRLLLLLVPRCHKVVVVVLVFATGSKTARVGARVRATEWTASVHSYFTHVHTEPVFKLLRNGLLRYILHTCPKL